MTQFLYRTPCSIKLINNTERACYAGVMTQFDEEIRLLQTLIDFKSGLINFF